MEIFLYRCYININIYIYTYKYINIINIIYILYMTALLLTFAVRRLFGRFFFMLFISLQDTPFPLFKSPYPTTRRKFLPVEDSWSYKLFFTFHIFPAVRLNDVSKVVRV